MCLVFHSRFKFRFEVLRKAYQSLYKKQSTWMLTQVHTRAHLSSLHVVRSVSVWKTWGIGIDFCYYLFTMTLLLIIIVHGTALLICDNVHISIKFVYKWNVLYLYILYVSVNNSAGTFECNLNSFGFPWNCSNRKRQQCIRRINNDDGVKINKDISHR